MAAGGGRALACGDFLIRWACRRLPENARKEQEREWIGELPAILADQDVCFAWMRTVKMLAFAAGVVKVAHSAPQAAKQPALRTKTAPRGRSQAALVAAIAAMSSAQREAFVAAVKLSTAETIRMLTQGLVVLAGVGTATVTILVVLQQHVSGVVDVFVGVGSGLLGIVTGVFTSGRRFARLSRSQRRSAR